MTQQSRKESVRSIRTFNCYYKFYGELDPQKSEGSFLLHSPNQLLANDKAHEELSNYCTKNDLWDYELLGVDEIFPDPQFKGVIKLGLGVA